MAIKTPIDGGYAIKFIPREPLVEYTKWLSRAKAFSETNLDAFVPSGNCFGDIVEFAEQYYFEHGNNNLKFIHGLLYCHYSDKLFAHGWIENVSKRSVIEGGFRNGIIGFAEYDIKHFAKKYRTERIQVYSRRALLKEVIGNDYGPWVSWLQNYCAEALEAKEV